MFYIYFIVLLIIYFFIIKIRLNNIIEIIKDEKSNEVIKIQDINKCTDQLIVLADKYIPLESRFISVIIEYYVEDIDLTTNQILNEFDKLNSYFVVDKNGNILNYIFLV